MYNSNFISNCVERLHILCASPEKVCASKMTVVIEICELLILLLMNSPLDNYRGVRSMSMCPRMYVCLRV